MFGDQISPIKRMGFWIVCAGLVVVVSTVCACRQDSGPIEIGFVGPLTGRHSDLGAAGRNGVSLAVEGINEAGGIRGRKVRLITKNDRHDPNTALKVDQELIDAGVVAIIGHMTSAMCEAVLSLINENEIVMISPTASSSRLGGKDDYFLRVMPPTRELPAKLAEHARTQSGVRNMAAICDESNRAYSEDYVQSFEKRFRELGGRRVMVHGYVSGEDVRFEEMVQRAAAANAEGLLIVAGALDAAMICQQLRKAGSDIAVYSSGWAMTQDFLHHGGRAVEGVVFAEYFDRGARNPAYLAFQKRYRNRFGRDPDFAAVFSYEAAQAVFGGLSTLGPDDGDLRAALLRRRIFPGLQGSFEIDKTGDAVRSPLTVVVSGGCFHTTDSPCNRATP